MGSLSSRQEAGLEDVEVPPAAVYRYPPKSGNYFASHFIMGGERFDSTHPEGYLFGENSDLNFLGVRPVPFPYAAPPPQDPVKTLRSLINIRKDTLRLVKCSEEVKTPGEELLKPKVYYNVEFTFDADARVAITIYYRATEQFQNGCASYIVKDNSLQSETVHYKRGVCQQFCLPSHTIDPSDWMEDELVLDGEHTVYPMVIHAVVDEGDEHLGHSHVLLTTFDKSVDGNCSVKPLKQKQVVDGVSYLLQEIYGIENKYNSQQSKASDHIPVGYEVVSLLEALNGPLTPSPSAPPIHRVRDGLTPSPLPTIGPDGRTLPVRTLSSLDRVCDNTNQGFKLKKSSSKSVSRSSSILHEEDEEKSFSDGEIVSPIKQNNQEIEGSSATPESENVTLSSSGAVDQSSCTGTPLSSTITSPEDGSSSLVQSVMSMASSQLSTDNISSMSGSYQAPGPDDLLECVSEERLTLPATQEEDEELKTPTDVAAEARCDMAHHRDQDAEGNAVIEEVSASTEGELETEGWWVAAGTPRVCENNNEQPRPMRLDNEPCPEDAVPGTTLSDDPVHHPLALTDHTDLKDCGHPTHVYGSLMV
ncbi:E3 ubiquitin ligase RNF157 isoform X6 [Chiloscyllium punctatum]|uniref:E3 ubiquitin ligase RNF157 isoform X6 n=1 Tax=Chiloscyllium punctatum TaxID=137246 RepID=UPI003B63C954